MQVVVRDNKFDQALKVLKKKMQREGIFREMKLRDACVKPSVKRAREQPKLCAGPTSSPKKNAA